MKPLTICLGTLLLAAIALLGGCEKKSDTPSAEQLEEAAKEATTKASEAVDEAKEAAKDLTGN